MHLYITKVLSNKSMYVIIYFKKKQQMIQIFIVFNLLTLFHPRIDQLFMLFTGYVFSWEHFLQHSSVQYFEENMTLIFVNESWCLNGSRVILPFYIYKLLFKVSLIFKKERTKFFGTLVP